MTQSPTECSCAVQPGQCSQVSQIYRQPNGTVITTRFILPPGKSAKLPGNIATTDMIDQMVSGTQGTGAGDLRGYSLFWDSSNNCPAMLYGNNSGMQKVLLLSNATGITSQQTDTDDQISKSAINHSGSPWIQNGKTGDKISLATQDWAKNRFLQLPTGSPPLKIQVFTATGSANNGSPRINFPETFSKTLSVSAIVNQTPGSYNSRFVNLLNTSATNNEVRVDNTGFNCQIVYVLGTGGGGTTGDVWTMLVTAIGVA